MHRLRWVPALRIAIILAIAAFNILPAGAASLQGIRTGVHGDSLRVVLDLEGEGSCTLVPVPGGVDWQVSIPGGCSGTMPPRLANLRACLDSIEGRCEGRDLIIHLRAREALWTVTFDLPAGNGKPRRFVIDLRPVDRDGKSGTAGGGGGAAGAAPSGATVSPEPVPEPRPRKTGDWRILIDPGHGGNDPGAVAKGIREKEVVLDVARRVAKILGANPGFDVRLSRTDDRFIPLRERRRIAEKYEADAFVSIHVNASKGRSAMGVEVFFLSPGAATDEASRELARLENEADPDYVVEEDSLLQGIPFGFDLRQSDTMMRSSHLAETILTKVEASQLAASRGVKQAGFAVLKSFQVPSALVEIGFLSNPLEAKRLKDGKHRERISRSIAEGIAAYFDRFARAKGDGGGGRP